MNNSAIHTRFPQLRLHPSFTRRNRLLIATVACSVVLHVLVLAFTPRFAHWHEPVRRVLEVMLVKAPQPVPLVREAPPPAPKPVVREREKPKPPRRVAHEEVTPKAVEQPAPQPQQVLTRSDPAPAADSAFSVPQPVAAPPAAPAAEEKSTTGRDSPAPREAAALVPPNFNAAYLRNSPPRYPLLARRNGVEGTVKLKVLVTRDGRAAQVQLQQSSGSSALDSAAADAVRDWQFVPAKRGQEPTESWVVVPVVFKLEKTG
jgi:protein TonB